MSRSKDDEQALDPITCSFIPMNRFFTVKPSVVHEQFNNEIVIVNLDSGAYYSAQNVANAIWTWVCDGLSQADILGRIRVEYSGDGNEISNSTAAFLDRLVEEGLVDQQDLAETTGNGAGAVLDVSAKAFSTPLLVKYTDMEMMLLLDPIHEVDQEGWPTARKPPEA